MFFCSLPTYLTEQYCLDWHHISQMKWKLVSSPDAQPKEKSAFGKREHVSCHSCGVRIPTVGEGWHFWEKKKENKTKTDDIWSQGYSALQKSATAQGPKEKKKWKKREKNYCYYVAAQGNLNRTGAVEEWYVALIPENLQKPRLRKYWARTKAILIFRLIQK